VFIQTALTADELRPLATNPSLDDYRKILYHRRGYAGPRLLLTFREALEPWC